MRRRVLDFRTSGTPGVLGTIAGDLPRCCRYLNEAQERLIYAGGETGWFGGWQRSVFSSVSRTNPYITLGREIAAIRNLDVCGTPVRVQNEFYEFLEGGVGLMPPNACDEPCGILETYERGNFPTMVDIPTDGIYKIRVYPTDTRDLGKRILFSGNDQNGIRIRTTDGLLEADGEYVILTAPFSDTVSGFSLLTAAQKDTTYREVAVYAVNVATGVETLLSRYAPDELTPSYRRYYLHDLPRNCCGSSTVQVVGMAKLEFLPVRQDTDWLLIGNLPALKEECISIHFGEMDNAAALGMADKKHKEAIRLLNMELTHYLGKQRPAITQPLFGTAPLAIRNVGNLL